MNRAEIADHILSRLEHEKSSIRQSYLDTKYSMGYFFVDDLLPEEIALTIYQAFPQADAELRMGIRKTFFEGVVDTGHVYKK